MNSKRIDSVNDISRKSPPGVFGVNLGIKEKKETPYKEGKMKDIGAHVLLYTHSNNASDVDARFGISNYLNFNGCIVPGTRTGMLNIRDRIIL